MKRERGTVKWFSDNKGYGFIERAREQDVFVHYKVLRVCRPNTCASSSLSLITQ